MTQSPRLDQSLVCQSVIAAIATSGFSLRAIGAIICLWLVVDPQMVRPHGIWYCGDGISASSQAASIPAGSLAAWDNETRCRAARGPENGPRTGSHPSARQTHRLSKLLPDLDHHAAPAGAPGFAATASAVATIACTKPVCCQGLWARGGRRAGRSSAMSARCMAPRCR